MGGWKFLQSAFFQSVMSYLPALNTNSGSSRKSLEPSPPQPPTEVPPVSSPVRVDPWKEEAERWKQLADKTAAERDELVHKAGQLHGDMQRLVEDLAQARKEAEEQWKTREVELKLEAEEEVQKREQAIEEKVVEVGRLAEELEGVKRDREEAHALLEIRKLELADAQAMAGRDSLEEAEVVKLLESLNEEIAQTAKSTKDMFKVDKVPKAGSKVVADAAAAIEGWVGATMPVLLSTQARSNPLLVQAGLQAMAVAFSSWISSSYSFMHEHDQVLDETYKFLMNGENQTILGRWRALTHKYAKQGMPNLTDELTKMLITDVRNLLLVAGTSVGQADALIARKRDSFRSIVEAAISFRRAIGEEIISCDFETILIHPGDTFDGANMDDSLEVSKSLVRITEESTAKKVLCTAGLGLRRCKKVKLDGEPGSQWEVSMIHKPQVVVDTITTA